MNYTIKLVKAGDVNSAARICALALGEDQYDCAKIDFGVMAQELSY